MSYKFVRRYRYDWRRLTGYISWRTADGSGNEERIYEHKRQNTTTTALGSWSPDGRVLVFTIGDPKNGGDLWTLSLEGDRKPKPVIQTQFSEQEATLSPDGRWIAYRSNSSGRIEVYVQPFPNLTAKWQISADGGNEPELSIYKRSRTFSLNLFESCLKAPIWREHIRTMSHRTVSIS